ncbi:MAG: hypothetical protein JXR63_01730 [Spirochaetales bacterium]|nr:hypothetical protein [Spirochaetales bacterium]
MGFFTSKKGAEIDTVLHKVKAKYLNMEEAFGSDYSLPLYNSFHRRYMSALNDKYTDILRFLNNEFEIVNSIIEKKTSLLEQEEAERLRKEEFEENGLYKKLNDRYLSMIDKYPLSEYHKKMEFELSKFLGAIQFFVKRFWPECEGILRKGFKISHSDEITQLERDFSMFCDRPCEAFPPILKRYIDELNTKPPQEKNLDRYKKQIFSEFVVLASKLEKLLDEYFEVNHDYKDVNFGALERISEAFEEIVESFRLQDLVKARKKSI